MLFCCKLNLGCLILFIMSSVGCVQAIRGPDAWPSQPFFGGPWPAAAEAEKKSGFSRSSGDVLWSPAVALNTKSKQVRATAVAHEVMTYLQGTWVQFDRVEFSSGQNELTHQLAQQNPLSLQHKSSVFEQTSVVCSVDPVVVVIAKMPVGTAFSNEVVSGFHASIKAPDLAASSDAIVVGLPGGILYGTSLPPAQTLWWASPDMNIKLTPLVFDAQGKARIEVPWGFLRIVPSDQGFSVLAEPLDK